jgi:hypothetical protein
MSTPIQPKGIFTCEQCGRRAGEEMLACPRRATDNCQWMIGPGKTLINRKTGQMWQQARLLGITTRRHIILEPEPVPIHLPVPPELPYPPSIAMLDPAEHHDRHAVEIVEHVLAALMAGGHLSVRRGNRYTAALGRPPQREHKRMVVFGGLDGRAKPDFSCVPYLLAPGPCAATPVDGALEQRLMQAVSEWSRQPLDDPHHLQAILTRREAFPPQHGVDVETLIAGIYDRDELNPHQWLIDLVREDALQRGIIRLIPAGKPGDEDHYVQHARDADCLAGERAHLRELYAQLQQRHPELLTALNYEVETGINLREAPGR